MEHVTNVRLQRRPVVMPSHSLMDDPKIVQDTDEGSRRVINGRVWDRCTGKMCTSKANHSSQARSPNTRVIIKEADGHESGRAFWRPGHRPIIALSRSRRIPAPPLSPRRNAPTVIIDYLHFTHSESAGTRSVTKSPPRPQRRVYLSLYLCTVAVIIIMSRRMM